VDGIFVPVLVHWLLLDLGHALVTLLRLHWPLSHMMTLRAISLLALTLLAYGLVAARQIQVEEISITTPKLATGQVTIAQISTCTWHHAGG